MAEIDYSAIPPAPAATQPSGWKPPRHVYFGPKDKDTGTMLDEPVYVHQEYPKMLYKMEGDRLLGAIVNSASERVARGDAWKESPADFGVFTAPSYQQMLEQNEMRAADLQQAVEPEKRGPGRPKGS